VGWVVALEGAVVAPGFIQSVVFMAGLPVRFLVGS
jgi:hypothetical protein